MTTTPKVLILTLLAGHLPAAPVTFLRVPDGGIQPQVVVDAQRTTHLIYFKGDARQGDIFYLRSADGGATFSAPMRVNSQPGSAIAAGAIRGAQIAAGKGVHVAWNGAAGGHHGAPMFYTRLNEAGTAFEPQRNLMQRTMALDGGGSVTADTAGNVYVAWHGAAHGAMKGEAERAVWVARSTDAGKTFAPESPAWAESTGACACCGLRGFADRKGAVYMLYRSAMANVNRDIYLLVSRDAGKSFRGSLLHKWEINACPMSSMSFAEGAAGVVGAWETQGQIYWTRVDGGAPALIAAPGDVKGRRHPFVAVNRGGETLLVWTEGTGWQKGGGFAWQVFDRQGRPTAEKGQAPGIPVWSFAATFVRPDDGFTVVY